LGGVFGERAEGDGGFYDAHRRLAGARKGSSLMPLYMLDTDTCVFVMRGSASESLKRRMLSTPIENQCISVVTLAELQYGVAMSNQPKRNLAALEDFVRHLAILELTEEAAIRYAEIRSRLHREGRMIGGNDLFIAAHALSLGAVLVTKNEREFQRVSGLEIENWHGTK
jgi:tRNA(fMet)-specific endonuclease VapC